MECTANTNDVLQAHIIRRAGNGGKERIEEGTRGANKEEKKRTGERKEDGHNMGKRKQRTKGRNTGFKKRQDFTRIPGLQSTS